MNKPLTTQLDTPPTAAAAAGVFRAQALAHEQTDAQGVMLLSHAPKMAKLGYALCVCFLLALWALAVTPHARKFVITAILLPNHGMIGLQSPRAGYLAETLVEVGQTVDADQLLMLIGHDTQSSSGLSVGATIHESVQTQLRLLDDELGALKEEKNLIARRRQQQTDDTTSRLALLTHEHDIARQRLGIAQRNLNQHRSLQSTAFVSTAAVEASRAKALEAEDAVLALRRSRLALKHDRDAAGVAAAQSTHQANQKILAVEQRRQALIQTLAQAQAARQTYLRAPRSGVIAKLGATPGQRITPTDQLISIIPAGATLQAVGYVPSSAVGLIKRGMPAYIRYEAYPYERFGQHTGQIKNVSAVGLPLSGNGQHDFFESAQAHGQPLYEIKIDIPSQALDHEGLRWPLQSGMRVQAAVVLDRRSLYARTLDLLESARAGIERSS